MKKTIFSLLVLTILLTAPGSIQAQGNNALGGELLSPVGLSYKFGINDNSAISGALGLLISDGPNSAVFEINYLSFQDSDNINLGSGDLTPYLGLGLSFRTSSNSGETISIRVPVGMEYEIDNSPFEIYMDIGPFVTVTDPLAFTFDSSLGFRYRFN